MKRLRTSSQVMVDGTILTRIFKKKFVCDYCKNEHTIEETTTEVHGKKIEYLNNCIFHEFDNIQSKSIFQNLLSIFLLKDIFLYLFNLNLNFIFHTFRYHTPNFI